METGRRACQIALKTKPGESQVCIFQQTCDIFNNRSIVIKKVSESRGGRSTLVDKSDEPSTEFREGLAKVNKKIHEVQSELNNVVVELQGLGSKIDLLLSKINKE